MPVSEETYRRVALEDPEGHWELHCGRLVRKPAMTAEHNLVARSLWRMLDRHLSPDAPVVMHDDGRLRRIEGHYFVPDIAVVPRAYMQRLLADPATFEAYDEPVPLVVEVWSPSTGPYDVETKLPEYQRRGDAEIWFLHPYQKTLTAWRQQPDHTYGETIYRGGVVHPVALPDVSIDLDALFTWERLS